MDFNNQLSKTILSCCRHENQDRQVDLIVTRNQNPNIILIYPQADLAERLTQLSMAFSANQVKSKKKEGLINAR